MMMPIEPGVVDTNILVYGMDADSPQHSASRDLLAAARGETPARLYVSPQILCEFYATVTNRRRVPNPRSSAAALSAITDMLGFLRILPVPGAAIDEVMALLRLRPVTGSAVFDLQIVATMKLNRILRIYTFNSDDFSPFPEIEVVTPE